MSDESTVCGLDEYSLMAPKMQVVVAAYVVHARRHSDETPIYESGEGLRMTLRSLPFNADLPLRKGFALMLVQDCGVWKNDRHDYYVGY